MAKLKEIFTRWKVIILIVFLIFALIAIQPQFDSSGVLVRSVQPNSSASIGGFTNPSPKLTPVAREKVIAFNGQDINSPEEYYALEAALEPNQTITLTTTIQTYTLIVPPQQELGLRVAPAPHSNVRKGLDLEGGTRVLLEPTQEISADELDITIASLKERLNVYGLSDVAVSPASDLSGKKFILIEIAGVTEEEVKDVLARQGKFEAAIANETVFFGGKKDITYVCRTADCSGINPQIGCSPVQDGYACSFFFGITLSPEAAERQAKLTQKLAVLQEGTAAYLSEDLVMYLDDKEVDRLRIGAELKGRATTSIQISGSGTGRTEAEAVSNALQNMKRLQTIIITGSLPTTLNVVRLETISPSLGQEFLSNIFLVGIIVLLTVIAVVYIRYRNIQIVIPMSLILISEIILIFGFAALVGWNLDLPAIAGILIMVGTAVDHLIIITDETLRGQDLTNWKQKIKNAMTIVFGAFLTTSSGMIPLWFAGAGLLKGFAFTTLVGLIFGVLIARSAYATIIEIVLKK